MNLKRNLLLKWGKSNLPFIILLFIFLGFSYDSTLDRLPTGQHLWRQADCLSITQHYAEGASFGSPEMHIQLGDDYTSGKTAGEFPILYYVIGKAWALFGQSLLMYRLIYISILFFGVFALFKTLKIIFKSPFWSITLTLLFISSPAYIFYSANFLTDGPAYSFTLIALYSFARYSINSKKYLLFLAMFFFSLAGLIKISSLMAFIFLGSIYLLELLPIATLGHRKLFLNRKFEGLLFILVPFFVVSWYVYAHYYNELHHFKYTFNNIFPLWRMDENELHNTLQRVRSFSSNLFFSRPTLLLLLATCIYNFFSWKKTNLFAYAANIILLIGSILYFILWAPLMGEHDYYYIALLILAPAIIVPFIWNMKKNKPLFFYSRIVKVIFSCFLFYNLWYCSSLVQLKGHNSIADNLIITDKSLLDELKYTEWDNTSNIYRLSRIQPHLKELGINPSDKVIVLPDGSFNVSLFLLNRKGWTNFSKYSTSAEINHRILKGAKFLFLLDDKLLDKNFLQPFLNQPIKSFEGMLIYKL